MHSGTWRSGTARAAAALICLAAAAACSSSSSPSATSSSSASASSPAATGSASGTPASAPSQSVSPAVVGPQACPNGSLQLKLGLAQGYAGGVYEVIDFTNTSGTTCTLFGYPGVSLVSGPPYAQIGLAAKRSGTAPVKQITLAPGATANALLQVVDALNFPTATCSPAKATDLRIYPPNQTAAVFLPSDSQGCAEPVQVLFISAVQAGSGGSS
ncbi:MAG TPA: DUF4232 domain-containing protein [Streptosporangiaceae bacterium]